MIVPMNGRMKPEDHIIVIFGANGDLAKRKLIPALYHLEVEGLMPVNYRLIGNSRSQMSTEQFKVFARESVDEFARTKIEDEQWNLFASKLTYVACDFRPGAVQAVLDAVNEAEVELGGSVRKLFYLSVPPPAFGLITEGLGEAGLQKDSRVVFEKPFGDSLEAYRELSETVHRVLDEQQVYRIDHFLGKETVQNILALRFANGMFEPSWNRHHIDHVQIDVPEELGVGTRAKFYEKTGALRDMIVTHLFQVLGFIGMEPPPSLEQRHLAGEVLKLFESMQPLKPEFVVRGQYEGYREEEGIDPRSEAETFVACKVMIDNWRWAGVPFFLRTGKRMAEPRSAVTLAFQDPPREMFRAAPIDWLDQDHLTLELGPEEGISITFLAKKPGPDIELAPAKMVFRYEGSFLSDLIGAYERLLHDALIGDRTLFTRGDGIERAWELVREVLEHPPPLHGYKQGSWGPRAATELITPRRWHLPE
jgi:glucose-6-phosphate 1-dehydrogenase